MVVWVCHPSFSKTAAFPGVFFPQVDWQFNANEAMHR
jgi:hypothetical protein